MIEIKGVDKRTPVKTWQGEGPYAKQRIVLLRFMTCNLKCHWNTADGKMAWCDTKWTWDGSEAGLDWDVDVLAAVIDEISRRKLKPASWEPQDDRKSVRKKADIVMITGGEPLLRQNDAEFQALVARLHEAGLLVHVETNGTLPPVRWARENIDFFAVSPKFQLYPKAYDERKVAVWATLPATQMAWKFVVGRPYDLEVLRQWLFEVKVPFDADVWLMPLTSDDKTMNFSQNVLESGTVPAIQMLGYKHVRISPRLQIGQGRDLFP
jgi:organic radical activating enzyme